MGFIMGKGMRECLSLYVSFSSSWARCGGEVVVVWLREQGFTASGTAHITEGDESVGGVLVVFAMGRSGKCLELDVSDDDP